MVRNPEVRAIFCARGGYGSGRIIPYLEPELLCANPKIINGSSDITALLALPGSKRSGGLSRADGGDGIRQGEAGYDRILLLDVLKGEVGALSAGGNHGVAPGGGRRAVDRRDA